MKKHPEDIMPAADSCCSVSSCTPMSIGRRSFLKAAGVTAAMLAAGQVKLIAGPFSVDDFESIIPSDKKLSKDWMASLYARGKPLTATGDDLKYIGMPINGLCTGQVYLGGDGRLWRWNLDGARDTRKEGAKGPRFMNPDIAQSPMSQGFALQAAGQTYTLDAEGFKDVRFINQYPMATVDYADDACPVTVELQAYTPFIPLNRDDSSYPVIVMRYSIKNVSADEQTIAIAGWVENISNAKSGRRAVGKKKCVYREFSDISAVECFAKFQDPSVFNKKADYGSIALGLFGDERPELVQINRSQPDAVGVFNLKSNDLKNGSVAESDFRQPAFASLGKMLTLKPGKTKTISFTLSWRFPNAQYSRDFRRKTVSAANHYATLWPTAADVASSVAAREGELYGTTRKWVDTWYDSTLPYWFLERTFVTLNCVQTLVGQRFAETGSEPEHYNFDEGVRCCPGNCTHVWHYAQGLARVFPQIERENRDKVEYGLGFNSKTGSIHHRYMGPEFGDAIDGNCGTILRVLRESQMTTDYAFLESIWDRVKLSMDHVIRKWDHDEDGLLEGPQHNTLDEPWFGQVHWLINLYHAALKASAVMARQMNQPAVAERYEKIVAKGAPGMVALLWNDDFGYFVHKPGPGKDEGHGSTNGCHIDQILGDSWLWNLGLGRILPEDKIQKALESLWRYNFTPHVGLFRKKMQGGRWYAAAGNAGLVMCTFPNGKIEPKSGNKNFAAYFNECMTGFEWQVAAHMIWEGMVEKGLAIGKAIYDRYLPQDRNPYNEIECSDHYSRAMASYGAFMAMCGYQYDGPEGKLAFGPRMQQEDFRAAFITAEGWGRFAQKVEKGQQSASIELRYGKLALKELAIEKVKSSAASQAKVEVDGKPVNAAFKQDAGRYILGFDKGVTLAEGQTLAISFIRKS